MLNVAAPGGGEQAPQLVSAGNWPERDEVVGPVAGCRAGGRWRERGCKAARDERGVPGDGEQRGGVLGSGPVQAGQESGKRAFALERTVGEYRQAEAGEARGVAVGADGDGSRLGAECRDHAGQHGGSADIEQRLVAATHAAGLAAGEDEGGGRTRALHAARHTRGDGWPQQFNICLFAADHGQGLVEQCLRCLVVVEGDRDDAAAGSDDPCGHRRVGAAPPPEISRIVASARSRPGAWSVAR